MTWYRWDGSDLLVDVRATARAHHNRIDDAKGDFVRLRVTAAPVEGKANAAIAELLAQAFEVPKTQVRLVRGQISRHKRFRIIAPQRPPPSSVLECAWEEKPELDPS